MKTKKRAPRLTAFGFLAESRALALEPGEDGKFVARATGPAPIATVPDDPYACAPLTTHRASNPETLTRADVAEGEGGHVAGSR